MSGSINLRHSTRLMQPLITIVNSCRSISMASSLTVWHILRTTIKRLN